MTISLPKDYYEKFDIKEFNNSVYGGVPLRVLSSHEIKILLFKLMKESYYDKKRKVSRWE